MSLVGKMRVGVLFACACLSAAANAAVIYSDNNPGGNAANWANVSSSAGGLYVVDTGNGIAPYNGGVLRITPFNHFRPAGGIRGWGMGHRYTPANYDPSSAGAIGSLDFSVTSRKGSYDGVRVAYLLMQNGKFYRSSFFTQSPGTSTPTEVFATSGMSASSFGEFVGQSYIYGPPPADGTANFGSNPDFSATGSNIQFGYLAHYDSTLISSDTPLSNTAYQMTSAWSVAINEVPEPATAGVVLLGGALASRRRR